MPLQFRESIRDIAANLVVVVVLVGRSGQDPTTAEKWNPAF